MAEIKWIKITVDMFDNEKIKLIESMPDADSILIIWVKLLTYAGKVNSSGYIMLTEKIPMNEEHLATIFNRPLNTIRYAIQIFEEFGMVEKEGGVLRISNWDIHQNIEGMDKIREQNRERKRLQRAKNKQKKLASGDGHVMSRDSHATELELELEEDKERDSTLSSDSTTHQPHYKPIIDYLNEKTGKHYKHTTNKTQTVIKARWNEGFGEDDFKNVIDIKTSEWKGTDMEKYLRPETLFGTKFESYLNQKEASTQSKANSTLDYLDEL